MSKKISLEDKLDEILGVFFKHPNSPVEFIIPRQERELMRKQIIQAFEESQAEGTPAKGEGENTSEQV